MLFVENFKIMINATGMNASNVKLQYLHNILSWYVIHHLENFCAQVGSTTMAHVIQFIFGFRYVIFLSMHCLSKKYDAPQNEQATWIKTKMLHCLYD